MFSKENQESIDYLCPVHLNSRLCAEKMSSRRVEFQVDSCILHEGAISLLLHFLSSSLLTCLPRRGSTFLPFIYLPADCSSGTKCSPIRYLESTFKIYSAARNAYHLFDAYGRPPCMDFCYRDSGRREEANLLYLSCSGQGILIWEHHNDRHCQVEKDDFCLA